MLIWWPDWNLIIILFIFNLLWIFFCIISFRFPKEETGELCAYSGGAGEDPEDGAAFRSNQSQVEGGSRHHRSGHHLSWCSLRVYCWLARAPAGSHQRGQVGAKIDITKYFEFNAVFLKVLIGNHTYVWHFCSSAPHYCKTSYCFDSLVLLLSPKKALLLQLLSYFALVASLGTWAKTIWILMGKQTFRY